MVKREELKTASQMMAGDLFWMVFVDATRHNTPAKIHGFREDAIKEAKRLSLKYPDHKVYILEPVGYCTVEPTPVNFTDYEIQGKPEALGEPLHQGGFS